VPFTAMRSRDFSSRASSCARIAERSRQLRPRAGRGACPGVFTRSGGADLRQASSAADVGPQWPSTSKPDGAAPGPRHACIVRGWRVVAWRCGACRAGQPATHGGATRAQRLQYCHGPRARTCDLGGPGRCRGDACRMRARACRPEARLGRHRRVSAIGRPASLEVVPSRGDYGDAMAGAPLGTSQICDGLHWRAVWPL